MQARAVFGEVAPAPTAVRRRCPGRPARIANPLTHKALARLRVFRGRGKRCFARLRNVFRQGNFPDRNNCSPVFRPGNHNPRSAGEDAMTARTAVGVMTGSCTFYLHGQNAPTPYPIRVKSLPGGSSGFSKPSSNSLGGPLASVRADGEGGAGVHGLPVPDAGRLESRVAVVGRWFSEAGLFQLV